MANGGKNTVFGQQDNPLNLDLMEIVSPGNVLVWRLSQNGSQLYYGTSDPTSTAGYVKGEFYVNTTTGTLFQNENGSWVNVTAFGPPGPAGKGWLSGAGVPSAGIGNNGDFYLNTINGDVYTKTAGSWGSPIENLTGPVGATGPTGATGAQGPAGTGSIGTIQSLDVSTYSGGDLGAKINAAQTAAGGQQVVLDCRNFSSPQTLSTAVTLTTGMKIYANDLTVTQTAKITLSGNNSAVIGAQGRSFILNKGGNLAEQIEISGNDVVVDNVTLNGGIGSGYTGDGILIDSGALRTIFSNSTVTGQYTNGINNAGATDTSITNVYVSACGVHGYLESNYSIRARISGSTFVDSGSSTGALFVSKTTACYISQSSFIASSANATIDASAGIGPLNIVNSNISNTGNFSAYVDSSSSKTYFSNCTISGGGVQGSPAVSSPIINSTNGGGLSITTCKIIGSSNAGGYDGIVLTNVNQNTVISGNYITGNYVGTGFAMIHLTGGMLGVIIENNDIVMGLSSSTGTNYGIWAQFTMGSNHFSGMLINGNTINVANSANGTGIYLDNNGGSTNAIGNVVSSNIGIDIGGAFLQIYDASGYLTGFIENNTAYTSGSGVTFAVNGNPTGLVWNQLEQSFTLSNVPVMGAGSIVRLTSATPTNPVKTVSGYSTLATPTSGGNWAGLNSPQVAAVSVTGLTANSGGIVLFGSGGADANYVINWYAKLTTAGGSSSTVGPFVLAWTDPDGVTRSASCAAQQGSGSATLILSDSGNSTSTSFLIGVPMYIRVKASTQVIYNMEMATSGSPTAQVAYSISAEIR